MSLDGVTDEPATTTEGETAAAPRLAVGLVVAGRHGPAWLADAISAIGDSGGVVLAEVVVTDAAPGVGGPRLGRLLLRAYGWIDGRIFGRSDEPTRIVDLGLVVDQVSGPGGKPTPATAGPDLVVRLDGGSGPLDRWPAPPFGTWSVEHGAGLRPGAVPDGLALDPGGPEMLLGRASTVSRLIVTVDGERVVVGQVVSAVDRLSLRRGSRGHVRKVAGLVVRSIRAVAEDRAVPEPVAPSPIDPPARSARSTLGSAGIAIGLARVPLGYLRRLVRRRVAPERWVVAVGQGSTDPRDDRSFRFLDAPDDREWADPFPVRGSGPDLVFIEEYVRANHRGRLAVVELDGSSRGWRSVETILDLPTHLSYPFVFEWSGSWYLMPEQAATGGLQLYVAETFPTRWRWHSTVLDRPAADATLAEIDGRWWLFTAISVPGGAVADELHLFHAPSPLGPWTAHRRNPVVSDVRSARPAGRVYRRDGDWYRVAQDGAITYGHSIAIVRIDRIDPDGYHQTVVDVIRPDWRPGLMATHTINTDAGLTALDALRTERRLRSRRPPA